MPTPFKARCTYCGRQGDFGIEIELRTTVAKEQVMACKNKKACEARCRADELSKEAERVL